MTPHNSANNARTAGAAILSDEIRSLTDASVRESGAPANEMDIADSTARWSKRVNLAAITVLLVLLWSVFGRTLGSYFLADDFGEVAYANMITHGRWDLFWLNWTGNYMQIPSMAVYRPLLMATLVWDQFIWNGNAFGFYLTNMLFVSADTVLVYAICRQLTSRMIPAAQIGFAFFTAALFAASPLHCESTSWVVGRVDTACCCFYLASILLFLKQRMQARGLANTLSLAASLLLFAMAMLVKEMAIGLPPLVTTIALLYPASDPDRDSGSSSGWKQISERIAAAVKESLPFWLLTGLYFVIRYLTLGTLLGGYTGGIGAAQSTSALANWLQMDIYHRVAFPLPYDTYGLNSVQATLLSVAYTSLLTIGVLRVCRKNVDFRLLALIAAWTFTTLAPIYKLWALGLDLEGSRFLFFLTVPLSAILPALIFSRADQIGSGKQSLAPNMKWETAIGTALISLVAFIYAQVSTHADSDWVHAGREVHACQKQAIAAAEQCTAHQRIALLGIPKNFKAAHMIYNGDTFKTMLRPPFASRDYSRTFVTFDPILFGHAQYINATRFKHTIEQTDCRRLLIWNRDTKRFDSPLKIPAGIPEQGTNQSGEQQNEAEGETLIASSEKSSTMASFGTASQLRLANLNLNPLDADFLTLWLEPGPGATTADEPFSVRWHGANSTAKYGSTDSESISVHRSLNEAKSDASSREVVVRIPVSHYWKWYAAGRISDIDLSIPPGMRLVRATVERDNKLVPRLTCNGDDDGTGVLNVNRNGNLGFDASRIPAAVGIEVQTTPPNFFFEQNLTENQLYVSYKVKSTSGSLGLAPDMVPSGGFTQVRVRAIDADGKPLGEWSDPLTLLVR